MRCFRCWFRHGQCFLVRFTATTLYKDVLSVSITKYENRYGYHIPRTTARDNYYSKLEEKRAADKQ